MRNRSWLWMCIKPRKGYCVYIFFKEMTALLCNFFWCACRWWKFCLSCDNVYFIKIFKTQNFLDAWQVSLLKVGRITSRKRQEGVDERKKLRELKFFFFFMFTQWRKRKIICCASQKLSHVHPFNPVWCIKYDLHALFRN